MRARLPKHRPPSFSWPEGKQAALSLSFDDARPSQVDAGTALLDRLGTKVTFYVVPSRVEARLAGWKAAVASGHEIATTLSTILARATFPGLVTTRSSRIRSIRCATN